MNLEPLRRNFPLFSQENYDFFFEQGAGWPVATVTSAPSELKRRLAAARVSYTLGLKSVDYALKRYLVGLKFEEDDNNRLDLRIRAEIEGAMNVFNDAVKLLSGTGTKSVSEAISEWTLLRIPFGMNLLVLCANRGSLYESMTIGRMLFEQLAWARGANLERDDEKVWKVEAQAGIKLLKPLFPDVGAFYGWLSKHAHWKYDAHISSLEFRKEGLAHQIASSRYKLLSLVAAMLLTKLFVIYIADAIAAFSEGENKIAHSALLRKIPALDDLITETKAIWPSDEELGPLAAIEL